jgi:LAO/AO transport system kinase
MAKREVDPQLLFPQACAGDRAALARLLTLVERGGVDADSVDRVVFPHTGRGYTVGITGAPGSGKSTLTDQLIGAVRAGGESIAVLAVDPSSPFSGGAILGDRVRMQSHATDADVFIRSMATRGHLGGLADAARQAIRVLDGAGFPWLLVETVGVGQVEVEIVGAADTTVVVLNPGWGDGVQANKAGIMEIADVFVVNKADRPGVRDTVRDVELMLELSALGDWRPPVVTAIAATGEGIDETWAAIGRHREYLETSGELEQRRRRRLRDELTARVTRTLAAAARRVAAGAAFDELVEALAKRCTDPVTAAAQLVARTGVSPELIDSSPA